jgi:hypothetical protein
MDRIRDAARRIYRSPWLPLAIVLLGIALRVRQYAFNRALWFDEALVSLNIVRRSYAELTAPLDDNQAAPIGFLLTARLLVDLLGDSEHVLRLYPLVCGVAALVLLYLTARTAVSRGGALVALTLLALSSYAIRYANEVKPYASDMCFALLVYLIALPAHAAKLRPGRVALMCAVGAVAIWFSIPSVFVLAGVGTGLVLTRLRQRSWGELGLLALVSVTWVASFVANYALLILPIAQRGTLGNLTEGSFLAFPPRALVDARALADTLLHTVSGAMGLTLPGLAAPLVAFGALSMWAAHKSRLYSLLSPLGFALLASVLEYYPFRPRFVLFCTPALLILLGRGMMAIHAWARGRAVWPFLIVLGLLFFYPGLSAANELLHPQSVEEVKPIFAHLQANRRQEDVLYVYYGAHPALSYYGHRYGLDSDEAIVGIWSRLDWSKYGEDLDKLRGNERVWVIFSHVCTWQGVDEERLFLMYLDDIGEQRDSLRTPGASLYLYDLSRSP